MKPRRCLAVLPVMLFCFTALAQTDIPVDLTTAFSTTDVTARNIVRLRISQNGFAKKLSGDAYSVPAGKRLVVNNATFSISGPTGFQPLLTLTISDFTVTVEPHKVPYSPSGLDVYVATMTAPLYVDPGQFIFLFLVDSSTSSSNSVAVGLLQGYLVDCGAAGCTQE